MRRDCPDGEMRDLLPGFVHETVPAGELERVARHVASCQECAAEVELIRSARAVLAASAPAMDVTRIVAAIPGAAAARRSGGRGPAIWRLAAAIALVALSGLSVVALQRLFDRGATEAGVPSAVVAPTSPPGPDAAPGAKQVPVSPGARAIAAGPRAEELSFGGGLADLSTDQLKVLLHELDALQAAMSSEPEVHATPIVPPREGGINAR